VLGRLLAGRCEVRGLGGKYGMGMRIIARREAVGVRSVFGLLDGDFTEEFPPRREWRSSDGEIHFGWRWERKEIENYLADPQVVSRALGSGAPPPGQYGTALEQARDAVADYEAARTALSISRVRFSDLPSAFGTARGRDQHPFPDALDEAACCAGLRETVEAHRQTQLVTPDDVEARFRGLLPECRPGGTRYAHYLYAFAGKDLLWAMDPALQDLGFQGAMAFREKVLVGIERATEDIGGWLAEWRALQQAVEAA
jgi:hypothetical protein